MMARRQNEVGHGRNCWPGDYSGMKVFKIQKTNLLVLSSNCRSEEEHSGEIL